MKPINQHELNGHSQRLREIFGQRFVSSYGDTYAIDSLQLRTAGVSLQLQRNASTIDARNERDEGEVCGVLVELGKRKILCSYFEAWMIRSKSRFEFDKAAMTFFLAFDHGSTLTTKQMFRLEWDNWKIQTTPNKAAYPHWQFDRWLTASDVEGLNKLRESFAKSEAEVKVFESPEQRVQLERPDLSWFGKVHFPAIAPWAADPIKSLDDAIQPHRTVPDSLEQLEGWIDSALNYLRSELKGYA